MVWKFRRRGYTGRVEDADKVKKIKDSLNAEHSTTVWDDAIGIFMMPSISYDTATKRSSINMSEGTSVKAFINTDTGEMRFYWLGKLSKD